MHEIRNGLLPLWPNCAWRSFTVEEDYTKVLVFEETRTSRKARERGLNLIRDHDDENEAGKERKKSDASSVMGSASAAGSSRSPSVSRRSTGESLDGGASMKQTKRGTWSSSSSLSREGRKVSCPPNWNHCDMLACDTNESAVVKVRFLVDD